MKTHSEISGLHLKEAYRIRAEAIRQKKEQRKNPQPEKAPGTPPPAEATPEESATTDSPAPIVEETPTESPIQEKASEESQEVEEAIASVPESESTVREEESPIPEPAIQVMEESSEKVAEKTEPDQREKGGVAEDGHILTADERWALLMKKKKEAREKRQKQWLELLEEIKPEVLKAFQERFKWNETRAEFAFHSLQAVSRERLPDLRRVIAYKTEKEEEKENLPKDARLIGDLVYRAEYLPSLKKEKPRGRGRFPGKGKGGKRGRRKGFRGRDREGRNRPGSEKRTESPSAGKDSRRPDRNQRRRPPRKPGPKVVRVGKSDLGSKPTPSGAGSSK